MAMKPIKSYELVTGLEVTMIAGAIGYVGSMVAGLGEVDLTAGAGVIDGRTKCLWTKDGHRIEVWLGDDGSFGAAKSKEIDPNKPIVSIH